MKSGEPRIPVERKSPAADPSLFDVVHPALLIPPDYPIRRMSRTDAGVALDRELVKLAGMDARCRLVQARLARRLIDDRAWRRLGFVRLSDYARERLGCSPRTIEDDARVLRCLDRLPLLRAALERGEVSWTQVRIVVRIASPENDAPLLELAATHTTRELERLVQSSIDARAADLRASPAHDDAGDPVVRCSIPVTPRGRRLWRSACEAASRAAGSPLAPAQVLELVVAEAASGEPVGADDADDWSPGTQEMENRLREPRRVDETQGASFLECFLAEAGVVDGFPWLDPASREAGPAEKLDALLESLDTADAHELDRRLRELRRVAQRIDFQLATLLRIGVDRRLFREIGFATVKLYVESRLGCSARRIWSLLAIERISWRCCPALREAWREGRISHLAACALLPVVGELHGEAWIRRAGEVTLRRLADEVAWALDCVERSSVSFPPAPPPSGGSVPPGGVSSPDLHEVQMRAHDGASRDAWPAPGGARLTFRVPLSVAVLLEMQLLRYHHRKEMRWRTFERIVSHAILEWTSVPKHRDPVFERDGWRCSVPGCSSRRNLHDHHVVFRSQGGGNERDNRITVCAAHHLHGIHAGIVRATGRAPDGLEWAIGCASGREPLMRLHGERYAEAA